MNPMGQRICPTSDWYQIKTSWVLTAILLWDGLQGDKTKIGQAIREVNSDLFDILEGIENDLYWSDEIL